jgi:hypothetical protein
MSTFIGIALWALIPGFIAKKKGRNFWGYYFLSFLITPLITIIITVCLKNISSELNHSSDSDIEVTSVPVAHETNSSIPGNISTSVALSNTQSLSENSCPEPPDQMLACRKIQYCRRCGFKLIDGSEFCSNCGNKIESEDYVE